MLINIINLSFITFKSIGKRRLLLLFISIIFSYLLVIFYIKSMSFGTIPDRILREISISFENISLILGIMLFIALEIPEELKYKRIYFLLSRGISKKEYITGKFLGFLMISFLFLLFFNIFLTVFFYINHMDFILLWKMFYFLFLKSLIWISVVVLLSLSLNSLLTVFFGFFIYLIVNFYYLAENLINSNFFKYIGYFLPYMSIFDVRNAFIHNLKIPINYFGFSLIYTLIYTLFLLNLALIIFGKKDL